MAHFTQLGLSGEPEKKSKQETVRKPSGAHPESTGKKFNGGQTAITVCSVIAMSLLGISLLETGGCSKSSEQSPRITAPTPMASTPTMPAPVADNPQPASIVAKKIVPKKSRQHPLVASTYNNPVYGLTFRYPKPYSLKEGDKANLSWESLKPAQMNFAQPGGTTVSAVQLPTGLYRGTDFASAFFTVSVNTNLTPAQCGEFAAPESHAEVSPAQGEARLVSTAMPIESAPVKMGAAQFTEVKSAADAATQSDAKYYHIFQNGTCYEFALGVQTRNGATAGTKAINQTEVFRKLNWMLSTVKIQAAGVPEPKAPAAGTTASSATASGVPTPVSSASQDPMPEVKN